MRASFFLTFLSFFLTLSLAAPTPLLTSSPTTEDATTPDLLPIAVFSPPTSETEPQPKTYGTYLHIADPTEESTQNILDLEAVEAAKEAVKEKLESGNGAIEKLKRKIKFRAGVHRSRAGQGEKKVERAF